VRGEGKLSPPLEIEMNYRKMLEISPKPYHTLMQAYTEITNEVISQQLMQKLLKEYDANLILDAIELMRGRIVDKPVPYLVGICRNLRSKQVEKFVESKRVDTLVDTFLDEKTRTDRPILRRPLLHVESTI